MRRKACVAQDHDYTQCIVAHITHLLMKIQSPKPGVLCLHQPPHPNPKISTAKNMATANQGNDCLLGIPPAGRKRECSIAITHCSFD